ncbi:MAG: hypothetical protein ACTSYY_02350, partial [Promethearchaeota archaeon]
MGKKQKKKLINSDSSIYELFSEFKSPDWNPFPFQTQFHDVFIPNESTAINFINQIKTEINDKSLKTIF